MQTNLKTRFEVLDKCQEIIYVDHPERPKLHLASIGNNVYNMQTMSQECYKTFGFNTWTLASKFIEKVNPGDTVLFTSRGAENYFASFKIKNIVKVTPEQFYQIYKPVNKNRSNDEQKDYREYVLILKSRQNVNIPKLDLLPGLGFKCLQCFHDLDGHYHQNLSSLSAPYLSCKNQGKPIGYVYNYYNELREVLSV